MVSNSDFKATVVDLNRDQPKQTDTFLVDTNVWLWSYYSRLAIHLAQNNARLNEVTRYITYLGQARSAKSVIYRSGLSFAELAHSIEKNDRDIFNRTNPPLEPKEFRNSRPQERIDVVEETKSVWEGVKTVSAPLPNLLQINDINIDIALQKIEVQKLDIYDIFLVQEMRANGISQIITGDSDFAMVAGITVFTYSNQLIRQARSLNKLRPTR